MTEKNHIFPLPPLHYLRLRCLLSSKQQCTLPAWKGSLLRGSFGHALRRTVCTMNKGQECKSCMLCSQCAYTRLFETFITKPAPRFLRGLSSSPRPFIFEPFDTHKNYKQNDRLGFDLLLIGEPVNFLPYVIFAVYQMAQTGFGASRRQFNLQEVYCSLNNNNNNIHGLESTFTCTDNWKKLYDGATQCILYNPDLLNLDNFSSISNNSDSLKLNFLTQTRLKFKNEYTIEFNFRNLVFKMLRRVLELAYFYSPYSETEWEFHDLLVAASDIKITCQNLHWQDNQRYSNRQHTKMKLGGFVGDLTLTGDLSPFLALLKYSEVLHVGKGCTFGLGKVGVETSG